MLDTLEITQELSILSSKIDKLSEKSALSIWIPIITSLITVIIGSLIAQAIDRRVRSDKESSKDIREIHSKCVNAKIRLRDLFRQLAMHKFHAQYWWHIHTLEPENEFKNKYYLEHLRSQSEARVTEKEIGQVKADFLGEVVKFERLKGSKFNVDAEIKNVENLEFSKAKGYTKDISAEKLREELAGEDEKELRNSYFQNLEVFQKIIDKMK